jgi:hypothetical protein
MDPTRRSKATIRGSTLCLAICVHRFPEAELTCLQAKRLTRPKSISEEAASSEDMAEAHFAEEQPEQADFAERQDFVEFKIAAARRAALIGSAACRLMTRVPTSQLSLSRSYS